MRQDIDHACDLTSQTRWRRSGLSSSVAELPRHVDAGSKPLASSYCGDSSDMIAAMARRVREARNI